MADNTAIEWTNATWNPVTGCSVLSPGCTNCYAMKLAGTRLRHHPTRAGLTRDSKAGPVWTGEVRFNDKQLPEPLRWRRARKIFVCAHGDLFHEAVPDEWIDRVFAVMALCPQHTFQVLTKRSARMRDYVVGIEERPEGIGRALADVARAGGLSKQTGLDAIDRWQQPLPNVWLGVSVEDQQRADARIPDLLATPATVRFISAEPLLGPVDLGNLQCWRYRGAERLNALNGVLSGMFGDYCPTRLHGLDWVIVGGESGPDARPMHRAWARRLRDQCAEARVPFFFKQWGKWAFVEDLPDGGERFERLGKKAAGRLLDGTAHDGMPA